MAESTLKRSRPFSSRQWGVGGTADLAPPDPNATRVLCTVIGMSPRFIAQDGSFAIWPAIWEIEGEAQPRQITIKGALGRVNPGEMLACRGRWKKHQQHGWSFDVTDYQSALPQTANGVATWLQTKVDGIGKTFAEAIVNHFGHQQVFEILDENPERLREVHTAKGRSIPERQLEKAIGAWDDVKAIRQIETFLFSHGVSANLADKLYRFYGPEVVDILQSDPYRITQLRGIGFKIADKIALSLGTPLEHPSRLRAGIMFVLDEAESDGHAFLTLQQLLSRCFEALNVQDPHKLVTEATELAKNGKIVAEADELVQQRVYSKNMYDIECRLSRMIRHMLEPPRKPLMTQPERPQARAGASAAEIAAMRLPSDDQWSVVETVRNYRLAMLTGGPGTGKCVRGDTPVLVNGRYMLAQEIWQRYATQPQWDGEGWWADIATDLETNSMNEQGQIVEKPFTRLWRQPVREFGRRIRFEDGSEIVATKAHRFHSPNGWTNDIAVGDVLCLPRTITWQGEVFDADLVRAHKVASAVGANRALSEVVEVQSFQQPSGNSWYDHDDNSSRATMILKPRAAVMYARVVEVEDIWLEEDVYDFEVAELHNYVANGVICHNTHSQEVLVEALKAAGKEIKLCAPTGKAARRMQELTGHPASTIHRLLEFSPFEGGFQRDESNPIEADCLIVDEASMLALDLADSLFRAVSDHTHVLLVGDPDQLPPVGVGKVLDDLINSEAVPRVQLSQIFRQAAKSMIVQNARRINAGQLPYLRKEEAERSLSQQMLNDFYWVNRSTPQETFELVIDFVCNRIPRAFGLDPVRDIMALVPMHKGAVGLDAINTALEERLNPAPTGQDKKIVVPNRNIAVGSRIVQSRNDYTPGREVMNGEIALVTGYDADENSCTLSLDDGEREISVPVPDMDSYYLAWAMSIHKSQGSEFAAVVTPVSTAHYTMLSRALTYTAVTRASKLCVMVGETKALSMAVAKMDMKKRNSTLKDRILRPALSGELF